MATILIGRYLDASTDSVSTLQLAQLVPFEYDDVQISYTGGDPTTVEYYNGGGLVATLTLTWVAGDLVRVQRT